MVCMIWMRSGLPNVAVSLLTAARTLAGSTVTDGNGAYRFQDLVSGDYFVGLSLPPGYTFSPQDQGVNELVDSDESHDDRNDPRDPGGRRERADLYHRHLRAARSPPGGSGTVKPPPAEINVCLPGTYSLGGISTVQISQLAAGHCLHAYLWDHAFAIGRIPAGAGRILSEVTFMEYFYQGAFVYQYMSRRDKEHPGLLCGPGRDAGPDLLLRPLRPPVWPSPAGRPGVGPAGDHHPEWDRLRRGADLRCVRADREVGGTVRQEQRG